ncbi:hypothetical protein PR048_029727 [Dryococelus australis]|uniref:Transposase n=1 Tax=Dryococelus australis TaxID=614101 RepID=A0ABQ9GG27_9NEOP|nr:hypothetical protein PR048_029727 [Dryococelus australis]
MKYSLKQTTSNGNRQTAVGRAALESRYTEQRRNERAEQTGYTRENPSTSGIVGHDSHMRKSRRWEASSLTAHPPRSPDAHDRSYTHRDGHLTVKSVYGGGMCREHGAGGLLDETWVQNDLKRERERERERESVYVTKVQGDWSVIAAGGAASSCATAATQLSSVAPAVRLLASRRGEPGSIIGGVATGFSHEEIVPDDTAGWRLFSGISRFPRPCIPVLFHPRLTSPSSALKTTMMTMPGAKFQGLLCSDTPTTIFANWTGPPRAPDLNPIEHLWDELDRRVRARQARPKSIAQLMEWLKEEWRRILVDVLQTLVESMPDRVAAVIAARDTLVWCEAVLVVYYETLVWCEQYVLSTKIPKCGVKQYVLSTKIPKCGVKQYNREEYGSKMTLRILNAAGYSSLIEPSHGQYCWWLGFCTMPYSVIPGVEMRRSVTSQTRMSSQCSVMWRVKLPGVEAEH